MLKSERTAKKIGPVVLIDPITIMLHLPDVAYNFTRRQPTEANEHQLYYFASMDMGVSHTLARSFFWSDVILWKKDLGDRRVTFSLAQRDLIVNAEAVGRYLASPNCDFTDHSSDSDRFDGYVESDRNVYGEDNSEALHDTKTNGNGLLATNGHVGNGHISNGHVSKGHVGNGHVGNGHATCPNSYAKIDAPETHLMPAPDHWKSRPWRGHGLEILWQRGIDHAQVFDSAKRRKRLISVIREYSAQPTD